MIRTAAALMFFGGLVIGVRVMFFGVQRRQGTQYLYSSVWPLALSIFLLMAGMALYLRSVTRPSPGTTWTAWILAVSAVVAAFLWTVVRRSATAPSTDPEDDPRYRFQGHIARVVQSIGTAPSDADGLVAFEFDGRREQFRARWTEEAVARGTFAGINDDVVIERVEGSVAFVEPWSVVEQRL